MIKTDLLTEGMEKFAVGIASHGVALRAYREAYPGKKIKDSTASVAASKLQRVHKVAVRIAELQRAAAKAASVAGEAKMFGVAEVMATAVARASVDANELVQHRRLSCRRCHGIGHHYQYKNPEEFEQAKQASDDINLTRVANKKPKLKGPSDAGGYGYRFNRPPHPECPECCGEGVPDVYIADSRYLSPAARRAYAGVKVTKDGTQLLMHSADANLAIVAKALGMLTEKVKLVAPDEKTDLPALPVDQTEASRIYQTFLRGDPT